MTARRRGRCLSCPQDRGLPRRQDLRTDPDDNRPRPTLDEDPRHRRARCHQDRGRDSGGTDPGSLGHSRSVLSGIFARNTGRGVPAKVIVRFGH